MKPAPLRQRTLFFFLFIILTIAQAQAAESDPYIEVYEGLLPIILEAPHGGSKMLPGIENHKLGGRDTGTLELTRLIREKMIAKTGKSPEMIAMLANRNFIEANRKPGPEAYRDPVTQELYERYYRHIDDAIARVRSRHGKGLLVSIHSGWTMRYEIEIGVNAVEKWSTIPVFLNTNSWEDFHGADGIGGRLHARGYEVPGFGGIPQTRGWTGIPALTRCRKEQNTGVDGMQFEFFGSKLLHDPLKRERLATDLADVLVEFVMKYYTDPEIIIEGNE
jgi:hypothetical protein